jgi:GT2 family glycosyltransferase
MASVRRYDRCMKPTFSVIVCSNRPERATRIKAHYDALFHGTGYEFILISDPKSLSDGYSQGFNRASGDSIVFSHDDVEFVTQDVAKRLRDHLLRFDVVGVAGTTKLIDGSWVSAGDPYCFALIIYPDTPGFFSVRYAGVGPQCVPSIQALDGCFLACQRKVVETVGFDSQTFDGFHLYDLDFTFGAYLKGFSMAVCRDLALVHESLGSYNDTWLMYRKRFEEKYRGRLSTGTRGDINAVQARRPKDQIADLCRPEALERAMRWMELHQVRAG